ncbi:MAG TPA: EAL domain-containing protein [Solirubrobacterales bacterium]|nr:EAL domain-containing protein [Solirubrobacterales bacterium]
MADLEERPDLNIPDAEERQLYREKFSEIAGRIAESKTERQVWAEASGPGSYRWIWSRAIGKSTLLAASLALGLCLAALAGWLAGIPAVAGGFSGDPPLPAALAMVLALLATAMILMRPGAATGPAVAGPVISGGVLVVGILVLLLELAGSSPVDWGDGSTRIPAFSLLIDIPLMALCLLSVDLDAPRFRWHNWLIPIVGIVFLTSIMTKGYRAVLITDPSFDYSHTGAIVLLLLYVGFIFMRPERGVAAFLAATGPGPSMARLLLPTALLIPASMFVVDLVAERLASGEAALVKSLDQILMLVLLLWMIAYASRRLQGFYGYWTQANAELTSQANVLTGMSEGVVMMKVSDSRIVLSTPQFDAMHGYATGDLIGRHIDTIAPPDLSPDEIRMRSQVMRELAENGEASYESRSVKRDGTDIWSRVNGVIANDPDHGPVLILVKYDVTEEYIAKSAGRDAEMRFRQVFEQSPIGLCLVTPEGRFEQVNQSFEAITGYSASELGQMTFAEITHPDDIEEDLDLTRSVFDGSRDGFTMEKRYIRQNGETVWVYLTVAMLRDSEGNPSQALSMVEDITERQRLSHQLQYLADHDPLTGLYNRRRFEEELNVAISSGHERGIAILVIDLDNFKFINDSFGHSVGDRLIVRTAELLRSRLRSDDTLARQGGDEFVVVLRDIEPTSALTTAEVLVKLVAREVRVEGAEHSARVTASIGVACASDGKPVAEETLMMQADIAMYEAKGAGRNRARVFQPGEDSPVTLGIDWAGKLRSALEDDALVLFAQPIVQLDSPSIPHFELFIRMLDRGGSLVRPGAFLPTAERHDLVQEVDAWVVRRAIRVLADAGTNGRSTRLSINLSGRTVGDPGLPDLVGDELTRTGIDPSCLIFEVTETSAIGNMTMAQEFSARMAEMGCGFALDDFGTGFASFYYLKHLAFDFVKIDGEFVQNLSHDPVNRLLVRALVEITRGMGKQTIAEQVEEERTLELLRDFGVDFVQGHYLGQPRPLEDCNLTAVPAMPKAASAEA